MSVCLCVTCTRCVCVTCARCVCYLDQACVFRYPHSCGVEDQRRCGLVCCGWPAGQPEPVGGGVAADRQPRCCGGYHANCRTFEPWDWQHHDDSATWQTNGPIKNNNHRLKYPKCTASDQIPRMHFTDKPDSPAPEWVKTSEVKINLELQQRSKSHKKMTKIKNCRF